MMDAANLTTGSRGQIWIHSDLQLADPQRAREVLTAAVDDLVDLDLDLAAVWCLGDAATGGYEDRLVQVADICIAQMDRMAVPVCYVLGNHEMDLMRLGTLRYPLYERAVEHPLWHTMASIEDFFFVRRFFGIPVVFMGDHAATDGRWCVQHGKAQLEAEAYPHTPDAYVRLRDAIAACPGPVITAAHQSYPGGQRPSPLMGQMLPLPQNVCLHVYGHAHIGDHVWNAERPYQRPNEVEGQSLIQYNISALETRRSAGSHSAILELGPEGPVAMRIRCHLEKRWTETFTLSSDPATCPVERQ